MIFITIVLANNRNYNNRHLAIEVRNLPRFSINLKIIPILGIINLKSTPTFGIAKYNCIFVGKTKGLWHL